MGYNTAAIILNDAIGQFPKDPELGQNIERAIARYGPNEKSDIRVGNHLNAMTVLPAMHANVTQVVLVGQNCIRIAHRSYFSFGYGEDDDVAVELLKQLASDLGYSVQKKGRR